MLPPCLRKLGATLLFLVAGQSFPCALSAETKEALFLDGERLYFLAETDPEGFLAQATSALPHLQADRARFNAVIFGAHALRSLGRLEEGLEKATTALEMARDANDPIARLRAKHDLAVLHIMDGDPQAGAALVELGMTLGRMQRDQTKTGMLLNVKGNLAIRNGDIDMARDLFRQSAEIAERTGNWRGHYSALANEAITHFRTGEYGRMITALEEALRVIEGKDMPIQRAIAYSNMGEGYLALGLYDKAEELILLSLDLERQIGNRINIAITYFNLGQVAAARRDWQRAEAHYIDALAIQREIGDHWNTAQTLIQWTRDLIAREMFEEAREKATETLVISRRLRSTPLLRDIYSLMADIDRATGDIALARYWESLSAHHGGASAALPGEASTALAKLPELPSQEQPLARLDRLNGSHQTWFLVVEFFLILTLCALLLLLAASNHRLRRQLQEFDKTPPPQGRA
ncbi:MAG: tetratricopeptide repeat protein [Opitutales bacterium]|nr:tetratricopeptide repeat protein [Opitutales bacterium]